MGKTATAMAMAKRIDIWPVERLIPYSGNARTHSDDQISKVASSIKEFGFTNPILVDRSDGIIAGHCRLAAAQKLGVAEVPVVVLDHLSDAQRRAYVLADNRLALDGGWDEEILAVELGMLQDDDFDMDVIGFSDEELAELIDLPDEGGGGGEPDDEAPSLAERFIVPPFSVLDSRKGEWQDKKGGWLALGIESEKGRGSAP